MLTPASTRASKPTVYRPSSDRIAFAERTPAKAEGHAFRWTPLREAIAVGLIVALIYLIGTVGYDVLIGGFNDDGVYLSLGRAIAEGHGYRSIHLAGEPVHAKYPPGLPAVLAVLWLFGGTIGAVQAMAVTLHVVAIACAAGMLWWLGRRTLGLSPLLLGTLVVVPFFIEPALQYFTLLISECWFVLGWAGALVIEARLGDEQQSARARLRLAAALGLVLAVTTLFRTQSILLAPTFLVSLAIPALRGEAARRRERRLAVAACAAALVLPLALWQWYHARILAIGPVASQPDESYLQFVGGSVWGLVGTAATAAAENVPAYLRLLAMLSSRWAPAGIAIVAVVLPLVAIGTWRALRDARARSLALAVLLNLAVVAVWPYLQDRFVVTLLPMVGILAALGADLVWRRLPVRGRAAGTALLVAGAASVLVTQVDVYRDGAAALRRPNANPRIETPSMWVMHNSLVIARVVEWVRGRTAPADVVISTSPSSTFLYTGRKGVPAEPAENFVSTRLFAEKGRYLATRIAEDRVTIIALESLRNRLVYEVAALQKACPGSLKFLGTIRRGPLPVFYRVDPNDTCIGKFASPEH